MDGIINVQKEKGYTSHDVVAKLRGIFKQKKIGHTGTLDPEATGVLPVCLGRATKVCELLTNKEKTYVARVKLGVVTDTQDMTGQILEENLVSVSKEAIEQVLQNFTGEIWQTPPMYSAVKVNGKRLYELARKGQEVERKPRKITVYSCVMTKYEPEDNIFEMEVTCSKGTYIRTLCHDIGEKLSCGAAMASLVRTKVDSFVLEQALTLSQIEKKVQEGTIQECVVEIDALFQTYPAVVVLPSGIRYLQNGNEIKPEWCAEMPEICPDGRVRLYDTDGNFYAIYRYTEETNLFTNVKMFYNHVG